MATVIDVSSRLGDYMLKGWVLTDKICTKCSRVPLMRSPPSAAVETHFCANCDPTPSAGNAANTAPPTRTPAPPKLSAAQEVRSASSTSTSSGISRSSTPPTEVSHAPSSPPLAPVLETAELLRRRRQSDIASAEIGKRMLKGWAMLADECPSPDCYGIPLVRPPKTGTSIDPRKECVICGLVYVDERDPSGQDRLVPLLPSPSPADTHRAQHTVDAAQPSSSSLAGDKGKTNAVVNLPVPPPEQSDTATPLTSTTSTALEASALSLERSLVAISERLGTYANTPYIDPIRIGQTAEAITKVTQALSQVKHLLWNENQALLN